MSRQDMDIARPASQLYGGLPARDALKADSPYYLVTQVPGIVGLGPKPK